MTVSIDVSHANFQPKLALLAAFGHFVPPRVSSPIEVYVEVETNNDMITGHSTLIGFWKPRYLMP